MKFSISHGVLAGLAAFALAAGCGGDDGGGSAPDAGGNNTSTLSLELNNLGDLGSDFVYEGWLITPTGPVSTGRFDMAAASETKTFSVASADADVATTFVLTIEPATGDAPEPAATHVIAGDFASGSATLTAGHGAALGDDFSTAAGSYILATPSTSGIADDFDQGVWFLDPMAGSMAGPGPSLTLPTLPDGWMYEGWVVGANGPVSTGKFSAAAGADADGKGPTAGADGGPPFPGQDYIDPAMVLTGGAVVISVEPSPDNAATPYFFKPLVDSAVKDVGAGMGQPLANVAADSIASGMATIQ